MWLQEAVDIRRAADALVQHYGVPVTRLAYVGHSYGATLDGVVAVGERRFRALVLMGGYASISDSILYPKDGSPGNKPLAEIFSAIDAEGFIGQAAPAALFLQFARYDRFITEGQANRLRQGRKHAQVGPVVRLRPRIQRRSIHHRPRENWLAQQLSLVRR